MDTYWISLIEPLRNSFAEFILDSTGKSIYDSTYNRAGGSKANRLRAFWSIEPNYVVAKLLSEPVRHSILPVSDLWCHMPTEKELRAKIEQAIITREDIDRDPFNAFLVDTGTYCLYAVNTCSVELTEAAEKRFPRNYVGCLH